jgi:thiazole synthase ThiGH ThiG subunit
VREGFVVLPYIHADPMLAKRLEEMGRYVAKCGKALSEHLGYGAA